VPKNHAAWHKLLLCGSIFILDTICVLFACVLPRSRREGEEDRGGLGEEATVVEIERSGEGEAGFCRIPVIEKERERSTCEFCLVRGPFRELFSTKFQVQVKIGEHTGVEHEENSGVLFRFGFFRGEPPPLVGPDPLRARVVCAYLTVSSSRSADSTAVLANCQCDGVFRTVVEPDQTIRGPAFVN